MKVAETKTDSVANNSIQKKQQPFFNKEGQSGFFSKYSEPPAPFFGPATIQPKSASPSGSLTIGQPNDKYEQEAEAVADQVMKMPASQIPPIQRKCEACEEEGKLQMKPIDTSITPIIQRQTEQENNENLIQAKAAVGVTPAVTPTIGAGIQSLRSGGRTLPKSERSFFESRFGADFSSVRVYSDARAAGLARSINARAFAHGNNIVFGTGEYSPGSSKGRGLLAHELTHVVQQGNEIRRFTTEDCPENVDSRIADSVTRGVEMLVKTINKLEEDPVSADVQRHFANHFGDYADWRNSAVRMHLYRVLSVMRASDIDFECESDCQDAPSNSAYVRLFGSLGGTVHLCLPWFRREGLNERAETFIHELFHWHIGLIGDPSYHTNNTSAHTSWLIASITPDAYSELAQDIYEQTP